MLTTRVKPESIARSIWWCEGGAWSGCAGNSTAVRSVVIDTDEDKAPFFSVAWVDVNGDGKKDLLASTNEANGRGGVYAYEQPQGAGNWRTERWTKRTLATGYKPTKAFLPGRGSPGTAEVFHIHTGSLGGAAAPRPAVVVSADDGGFVDLLLPTGAPSSWGFAKHRIINSTGTVGTVAVGDMTGDGLVELAVPLYAENKVAIYTFAQ